MLVLENRNKGACTGPVQALVIGGCGGWLTFFPVRHKLFNADVCQGVFCQLLHD